MKNFLNKIKYQLLIFFITLILFFINYKSGTYLSGWDNLQTDLNPLLAIKRAFFSVWQEYQSFGLLAGMAHAADLPRAIYIEILSIILPQNLIRYFYHFLMILIGGLGVMKLFSDQNSNLTIKQFNNNFLAFLAALFYILNLGTVQIFYLPFESFSTFFGFLPWLIWIFLKLISNSTIPQFNNLILFIIINFFATPSFYTQQLFIVYLLILGLIFIGYIFTKIIQSNKNFPLNFYIKKFIFSFLLIFIINSFWLLPQLYFLKTSSRVVYEAKMNQLATEDVYYQNREKGTLKYFLRLEGYYFDLFDKENHFIFAPWKNHFQTFWPIQYFFAFLMILGVYYSFRKKDFTFIFPLFLIFIVFLNATWPISAIDDFLRQNKLYNQIFRSPFTKFIFVYSLLYSYFLALGIQKIVLSTKNQFIKKFFLFSFVILIILYSLPSFQGNFISNEMKVKIPDEYFQIIDYFKKIDKNKRIALLPEYTFWGWYQNKWGYNGSGFLWYGIEQPIVSRTFDTWSEKSESYFWEIKKTINDENLNNFENVLEKYDINYLVLDLSLKPLVGNYKSIQYDRLINLLSKSQKIKLLRQGKYLNLYQVNSHDKQRNFIQIKNNLFSTSPKIKLTDDDTAFKIFGDYFYQENPNIYFPFLDLTTVSKLFQKKWQLEEEKNYFNIKIKTDFDLTDYQIQNFNSQYQSLLYNENKLSTYSANISYKKEKNELSLFLDKILIKKITEKDLTIRKNCFKNTSCISISLPVFSHRYGYLIKIKNKNFFGRRLFFYVLEQTKKSSYVEDRLKNDIEYYLIPESYYYGMGYNITFHNQNYENLFSENKVESIEIYFFPYENLKSIFLTSPQFHIENNREKTINQNPINFDAKRIHYFLYQIKIPSQPLNSSNNLTLYLSQSYHDGWKAYVIKDQSSDIRQFFYTYFPFIFGQEIKDHVLVNNWANGWLIDDQTIKQLNNSAIYLIFWPQYLEFLGFGLLIFTFIFILLYKPKTKVDEKNN